MNGRCLAHERGNDGKVPRSRRPSSSVSTRCRKGRVLPLTHVDRESRPGRFHGRGARGGSRLGLPVDHDSVAEEVEGDPIGPAEEDGLQDPAPILRQIARRGRRGHAEAEPVPLRHEVHGREGEAGRRHPGELRRHGDAVEEGRQQEGVHGPPPAEGPRGDRGDPAPPVGRAGGLVEAHTVSVGSQLAVGQEVVGRVGQGRLGRGEGRQRVHAEPRPRSLRGEQGPAESLRAAARMDVP